VDLFFVLSGFLIGGILLKTMEKTKSFGSKDILKFWKRRWFRTLPAYYLILLLNFLAVKFSVIEGDLSQFNFNFLLFTHNFATPFYGFFWESWSLSVEEWFYIFSPILLLILFRFFSAKRAFLIATLIMILTPVLYRWSILDPTLNYFWLDVTFRKVVLTRLDSIGYGLLAAWTYSYFHAFWKSARIVAFLAGFGLLIFILNYESYPGSVYEQLVFFSLVPISAVLMLPLVESFREAKGRLAAGITHISKISYSMYLINLALVAGVIHHNFAPENSTDAILKYILYWALVVIVSSLLYKYFEKSVMDLRDKSFSFSFLSKTKNS